MIERQYGRIINVASLAPYIPPADRGGLYSPVKIFQIKLTLPSVKILLVLYHYLNYLK